MQMYPADFLLYKPPRSDAACFQLQEIPKDQDSILWKAPVLISEINEI